MADHETSNKHGRRHGRFAAFAEHVAFLTGRPFAFGIALSAIVVWLMAGPFYGYSTAWQMVGGVGPTLITFLMVFLIQNLQNRENKALHIKLDELIRATEGAHTSLVGAHKLTEEQLKELGDKYSAVAEEAKKVVAEGGDDTGKPNVEVIIVEEETIVSVPKH